MENNNLVAPAVLFDFDGTLVNSITLWIKTELYALEKLGFDSFVSEDFVPFDGHDLGYIFDHLVAKRINETDQEKLDKIKTDFYKLVNESVLEMIPGNVTLMPQAKETLELFKEAGFRIAICSNGPLDFIETTTEYLAINNLVEKNYSAVGTGKSKPDPYIFQLAVEEMELDKNKTIVVEDSESGRIAARAAGLPVAFLAKKAIRTDDEKVFVIESLAELTPDFVLKMLG